MINKFNEKPLYWDKAIRHLKKNDKVLEKIITKTGNKVFLTRNCTPFQTLVNAILGQQISVKAASSISSKLKKKIKTVSYKNIQTISRQSLRACGLSKQKINYLKNISFHLTQNPKFFYNLKQLDDESVIDQLCLLKGIGEWTAQMYLIFQLNRPNILPMGDLGFINSTTKLYGLSKTKNLKDIVKLSNRWEPYKTVAVWYIWRIIDSDVVQY
ncbi:MAG: DNA-3-methyladenine glycosylase 2 family protein [Pseudomonadota bacterium]|nr:DNA-3-methyladenine glycosylase 2 family protein [Pseudomonadota bacterium]|tara:strand:- start:3161 stop:3799 length:639 start_codon:yes stop_codon:yes gene_type:complete